MTKASNEIRKMIFSAVFLSIALVLKTFFTFSIPLFGQNGMRIGISGIFTIMPAILFGPVYGCIVSALSDVFGYLLKPAGAYMPLLTLAVGLGGFIRGLIWIALRKRKDTHLRIAVLVLVALAALFGIWNMIALNADGVNASFYLNGHIENTDINQMHTISRLLIERTVSTSNPSDNLVTYITFTTIGPIGFAVFGFVLILADFIIGKKLAKDGEHTGITPILITLLISGIIVNTLDTIILREFLFESWKLLPFSAVWLPRAIEAIVSNTIIAYFVALLYGIFVKTPGLKSLIRQD